MVDHSPAPASPADPREPRTADLFLGLAADNTNGIHIDANTPARELFRCWVKLAQVLCKHPGLSKSRQVMCDIVASAVTLTGPRKPARPAAQQRDRRGKDRAPGL